jgi:hypothetical protein
MAKVRRNGPCPCGSGRKAKRCCAGLAQVVDVGFLPSEMFEAAIAELPGTSQIDMRALFEQLLYLPEIDLSLQVPLPGILTPEMDRAIRALREDDGEEFDRALVQLVPLVDTADRRIELARAVLSLRDGGRIPRKLAAMAVLELDRQTSTFFLSSVAESLAVLAGDRRTPSGLLVASR